MAQRNAASQSLHDQVISIAAANLGSYSVYTNPGQQQNAYIGNSYPDIILANRATGIIEFIIEVETRDSITAHEAISQWRTYMGLPGTFYLMVPFDMRAQASFLCGQYGILAKFATYQIDALNRVQINYEQ